MEGKPKSDIVELILAVDLDPTNPEEPINVDVVPQDEGKGKGQSPLVSRLFKAMAKMNPEMKAIVDGGMEDEETVKALEKIAAAEPSEAQDEADSFDKAMDHMKPSKSPSERYGKPEAPKDDFKPRPPKRDDFADDDEGQDFEPRKKSGGFGGARDRAFGKKSWDDEGDDEGDDFKKKKEW